MGIDENFVFSLSSSDGSGKDEDCTLVIWPSATLAIPTKDENLKKNHNAKLRNCVHPKLLPDKDTLSTDLWVLVIAEYMQTAS